MANIDSITVRMYNTGSVGDCLFLQFKKNDTTSFTMLIDCGGYHTDAVSITNCVADIKKTLGYNIPLDLVVVTHEHLDHVSGFNQAKAVFDSITFNQVWMAWTEDPTDELAKKLKKNLGKKLKELIAALTKNQSELKSKISKTKSNIRLKARLSERAENWGDVLEALHFENGTAFNAAKGLKVSDAMKYVAGKSKLKAKAKMFHKPGEVLTMKGAEGIKFHILGPPYDEDLSGIKNKTQKDEMYSLAKHVAFARNQAFLNAASSSSVTPGFSKSPFSEKYFLTGIDKNRFFKFYNSADMLWRQIEEDWLESSEELAIAVNTYTNNTSLVIAMEFTSTGKVLLFPADAQSGNWISWHNPVVAQTLKRNGGKTAKELLADTVFYKVGHHGSHNGTASKSGLEKMNKLKVAMMPLVQNKVPSQWGGSKNFPAKALYTELINKTNGAILRTDEGAISDKRAVNLRTKNLSAANLRKLNEANKGLYQEWTIDA